AKRLSGVGHLAPDPTRQGREIDLSRVRASDASFESHMSLLIGAEDLACTIRAVPQQAWKGPSQLKPEIATDFHHSGIVEGRPRPAQGRRSPVREPCRPTLNCLCGGVRPRETAARSVRLRGSIGADAALCGRE